MIVTSTKTREKINFFCDTKRVRVFLTCHANVQALSTFVSNLLIGRHGRSQSFYATQANNAHNEIVAVLCNYFKVDMNRRNKQTLIRRYRLPSSFPTRGIQSLECGRFAIQTTRLKDTRGLFI